MDINNVVLNTLCEIIASQKNKIKELENKLLDKEILINGKIFNLEVFYD